MSLASATSDLVDALWRSRQQRQYLETDTLPPLPVDLEAAYEAAESLHRMRDGAVAGWKLGATSDGAQAFLGVSQPIVGRIYRDSLQQSPATLVHYGGELALEAEFGLCLADDFDPAAAYTRETITAAVSSVVPLLEVNRPSYLAPFDVGVLGIVADNAVNAGALLGTKKRAWNASIATVAGVAVSVNGRQVAAGSFADSATDPLDQLLWLVKWLVQRGTPALPGQVIAMGSCAGTQILQPGDQIQAYYNDWEMLTARVVAQA